jgi:chemotaxis protein methyltransferase CheR
MTTNKTGFFREPAHFNYLKEKILPQLTNHKLRFWSSACSSGEECWTLAIVLKENITDMQRRDIKILATDISSRMLDKAKKAVYEEDAVHEIPQHLVQKYFVKIADKTSYAYQVKDDIRSIVKIARLNLLDSWPMKGLFNVIFCRNVMIYFDRPTQQTLVNRFWNYLESGGHLFVGHSEGLSAISHKFEYIQPAIYRKN